MSSAEGDFFKGFRDALSIPLSSASADTSGDNDAVPMASDSPTAAANAYHGLPFDHDEVQAHYLRFRNQYLNEEGIINLPVCCKCTSC